MASQRRGSSSPSSGDQYDVNSETAGASCWSPRTKAYGRQPWTSRRRSFTTSERRSSRPKKAGRVRPRQEARLCSAFCLHKALLHILPAQAFAPHFASTSLCSAFCQHKPQDRLCPLHLWACPECDRLCILLLSACSEFCLGIRVGSGPRTISDKVRPYAEDFMGPSANLHLESGRSRSSRQPGLLRSPCRPRWVRQKPKRKRCRLRAKSASDRDSDRLAS